MIVRNQKNGISLRQILQKKPLASSVPCRVDCGNTVDIRPLALFLQSVGPATVNIALDLRTKVVLRPFEDGQIRVTSRGFPEYQFTLEDAPLSSPVGLIAAIVGHFNVHSLHLEIHSSSPPRSGLGGSGTLAIGIIAVINEALGMLGHARLSKVQQICLAQNLEEGLGSSRSGLQDQVAAMYGGVHQWIWDYRNLRQPFRRVSLLDAAGCDRLSKHILVAYTGSTHPPSGLTQAWLDDFVCGRVRHEWKGICQATSRFADAIRQCDWRKAVRYLNEECQMRVDLWPSTLDEIGRSLVDLALQNKCGARFCGGGNGGCVWAIGEGKNISSLMVEWGSFLEKTEAGKLLETAVSKRGLELRHEI